LVGIEIVAEKEPVDVDVEEPRERGVLHSVITRGELGLKPVPLIVTESPGAAVFLDWVPVPVVSAADVAAGEPVGVAVGDAVGEAVGVAVGDKAGEVVGEAVGVAVGSPMHAVVDKAGGAVDPGGVVAGAVVPGAVVPGAVVPGAVVPGGVVEPAHAVAPRQCSSGSAPASGTTSVAAVPAAILMPYLVLV
jgi:hypothetical protein